MGEVEQQEQQDFKITVADAVFAYKSSSTNAKGKAKLQQKILDLIFANNALHLYQVVSQELGWRVDEKQAAEMAEHNKAHLAELDEKIKDAEENAGDIEVRDQMRAKAAFLASTAPATEAMQAYDQTAAKSAGAGPKLDLAFSQLRIDIAAGNWRAVSTGLEKAKVLGEEGGDWERKNRLKVYNAIFFLATRDIKQAAALFLDSIATFSSYELFEYKQCIFYAVITSIVTLDRVSLKEKVVDAPEILSVIASIPHLEPFLNNLYACRYKEFFKAFVDIADSLREDRYMQPHFRYYLREVRVVAYSQFLDSYKSVTLQSMASAFGVSVDFLDEEIADFIVAGRLAAKIDRISGIVETVRPDAKNAHYQQTLKQGDLLLNRLQKLSKVVDIE